MANNVNDKGDIISQLLRVVNVPICVSSARTGHVAYASAIVHQRLYTLINRRMFRKKRLGQALLTRCVFKCPRRIGRIGTVVRPQMGSSFQR